MKYHRLLLVSTLRYAMLALASASLFGATPTDEGVPVDIDIRSEVDQRWDGLRKGGAIAHGKVYALISVKDVSTEVKLIKPVDEAALVAQVRQELGKNGFREIAANEKPEIVITVTYGRGYLRNPYLADAMIDDVSPGEPVSTVTSPKQVMRQKGFNAESKLQKAQFEKLYIAVTAYRYPEKRGDKPHQFWRTVMATDNPAGRDLNLAMPAMLAAGVGYFDKEIKEPEVTINSTVPKGSVIVAPFEVIEMEKKKSDK